MAEPGPKASRKTPETRQSFLWRVHGMMSNGFAMLGVGLGSQLGLFDLMAAFSEPKTSQEIADAAGYRERYVREWLGLMAVSEIIEVDSEGRKFFLPPHRHRALTGLLNLARMSEGLYNMSHVGPKLMECFKKDGPRGIPYSSYPGILNYLDDIIDAGPKKMIDDIRKVPQIHKLLEQGVNVADVGCSSGITTEQMARAFPKSVFTGMDISEEAIIAGQKRISQSDLQNISLTVQDACNMPSDWTNKWDCIFIRDAAHDVPFTRQLLRELNRVLTPGGQILMVEINLHTNTALNVKNPMAKVFYTFSLFHCTPVSLSVEGGEGWGCTWGKEKVLELLGEAGFTGLEIVHSKPDTFFCVGTKLPKSHI